MKKWKILNSLEISEADSAIKILLANRGLKTKKEIESFLTPNIKEINYESVGIDKKELDKAVNRINSSIKKKEKIIIFGDYDVDGICASAILWETLYKKYDQVLPYIPHRESEGYGLSVKGIDNILIDNPNIKLIITVDNGIVAYDAIEYAKKKGIDVVVTDHHVVGEKTISSFATVHTTKLCGAGVALILALAFEKNELKEDDSRLDLVALATVADLVPLIGANRTLLKFGLEKLRKTKRVGLLALLRVAVVEKEKIGTYEIGHIIAPRLNAAGRISHAIDGLRLVCTKDADRARKIAWDLNKTNKSRQDLTAEMTVHAKGFLKIATKEKIIIVYDKSYSQGVVGLVASRLVELHYKPSFVMSVGEEISKGSARSIKGFNVIDFLRTFDDFLLEVGGHPMAAGFSLKTDRIVEFKKALEVKAKGLLSDEILSRSLAIDALLDFKSISPVFYRAIQELSPFGMGNPQPIFATKKVVVGEIKLMGKKSEHAKITLEKDGKTIMAVLFGIGDNFELKKGDIINVAYSIDENVWNGKSELQLKIKDYNIA